ncbi:MAG: hypothetical protein KN64_07985 [Sulfurovum sp. AS07-7]|nr:MAG: hypothetical protein KN64_07985 [Sulfurovum sp. AS07-7]
MAPQIRARAGSRNRSISVNRPSFSRLWKAYEKVNLKAPDVYKLVGGNIYELYLEDCKKLQQYQVFQNACAIRMSYAFNYGGYKIPTGTIIKGKEIKRFKGADNLPYIVSVDAMIDVLTHKFGNPEYGIATNGKDISSQFSGKKGIMVFVVEGWGDATGHVVLWSGSRCSDGHWYFIQDRPTVKTIKVLLWELK